MQNSLTHLVHGGEFFPGVFKVETEFYTVFWGTKYTLLRLASCVLFSNAYFVEIFYYGKCFESTD